MTVRQVMGLFVLNMMGLALPALAAAGGAGKPEAFTEAAKAGPDFAVQGEYVGQMVAAGGSAKKLGAQIVALGGGTFRLVLLPGGLPGEGWDGKERIEVAGKMEAGKPRFSAGEITAGVEGEKISGQRGTRETFELSKTVRKSPTEGLAPPAEAIVLFNGAATEELLKPRIDERKLLACGTSTKRSFSDFTLHVEFCLPFKPAGRGQDRGNSGVYIQRRYEVQVLDSFGMPPAFNECASIYRQVPPALNMSYPPLAWQTYDIDFTAAKWDASGKKMANATITLKHNGVVVHDRREIKTKTGAGQAEGPTPGPILFQDHGNPVFFRNVWIVERK